MASATHERVSRLRASVPSRRPVLATLTVAVIVFAMMVNPTSSDVQAATTFSALRGPGEAGFIAAHRGDKQGAPENTLPAMEAAIHGDVDFIETDLQLTADDVPVLMHDWTVDRTTDGTGPVWGYTYDELAKLDAGSWYSEAYAGTRVPTLAQLLEVFVPSTKRAILELKGSWTAEQARIVTTQLFTAGVQHRVVFASFDLMTLRALEEVATGIPRFIITRTVVGDPAILASQCGAIAIVTSRAFIDSNPDAVREIHAAGLGVLLYTLNEETDWSSAVALGVDGIITDKPSALTAWLTAAAPSAPSASPD